MQLFKKSLTKILVLLSSAILRKHKPFIIAITGNLGKTTTKDSIAAAFAGQDAYVASKKSLNSDIGIPLTIIGASSGWRSVSRWLSIIWKGVKVYSARDYKKYLILEVGADAKGDIENITKYLHPNITVMTQFAEVPVHVENFKDREELIREKKYLAEAIVDGGTFIYNSDCVDSREMLETLKEDFAKRNIRVLSFGTKTADIVATSIVNSVTNKKVSAKVILKKDTKNILNLECDGVLGESPIICALPAILIADELNLDVYQSLESIKVSERAPGRMRILDGRNKSIIIDDSYNSSPLAAMHGVKTAGDLKTIGRKIFVIGDMMELGKFTKEEHIKLGKQIAKYAHILITVGLRSRDVAESAMDNGLGEGWVLQCDDAYEAGREVQQLLRSGDLVYLKGSQSMRLERATMMILDEDLKAKDYLPRQESEWLRRT